MSLAVPAIITDDAREFYLQFVFGGLGPVPGTPTVANTTWDSRLKFFRVGEGGWTTAGLSRVQRTPLSTLRRYDTNVHDIDARVDTTRLAAGQPERYEGNPLSANYSRGSYQKSLAPGDITVVSSRKIQVDCTLGAGEFNEDSVGSGRSPELWEIALFADHPTLPGEHLMVAYGTFPQAAVKTGAAALAIRVYLTL